jgi:hypothetical protein
MKCVKLILVFAFMSLLLSACGDSGGSHHASWESATLVAENASNPQVVSDGDGNLMAVWAQLNGIYTNSFNSVTGWGVPQKIADISNYWNYWARPWITLSKNGQFAAIAYDSLELGHYDIMICDFKAGTGWRLIENLSLMYSIHDMAIDNGGNLFLTTVDVFMNNDTITETLTLFRYNQTDGWNHDHIDTVELPARIGRNSRIALDGSGNGLVIWSYVDFGTYSSKLFVRRFSTGALGEPVQLADATAIDWGNIAFDNNGNAMALWGEADPSLIFHTYASRYTPMGGWGVALKIDDSPLDTIDQFLSFDPVGNFHAVWSQRIGFNSADIYSCKFTPSSGWQTPKFVGSGGGVIARFPRIAADNRGNLFAAWLQYDPNAPTGRFGGDGKVYGTYCRNGSDWKTPQLLTTVPGDAASPSIAVDQSGGAMVIWSQTTGSVDGILTYGVFSSRFR